MHRLKVMHAYSFFGDFMTLKWGVYQRFDTISSLPSDVFGAKRISVRLIIGKK